jgi:predicted aspartyl protease
MIKTVNIILSGKKGNCNLEGISIVDSLYSYISKEVTTKICDSSEIKQMTASWTNIKVDIASVKIEVMNKKKQINVIVLDLPDVYIGTGTLQELGISI